MYWYTVPFHFFACKVRKDTNAWILLSDSLSRIVAMETIVGAKSATTSTALMNGHFQQVLTSSVLSIDQEYYAPQSFLFPLPS